MESGANGVSGGARHRRARLRRAHLLFALSLALAAAGVPAAGAEPRAHAAGDRRGAARRLRGRRPLSYVYVEQPIRRRRPLWRGLPLSFPVAAAGSAAMIAIAALLILSGGLPARVPADVRAIDAEAAAPLDGRWCEPSATSRNVCAAIRFRRRSGAVGRLACPRPGARAGGLRRRAPICACAFSPAAPVRRCRDSGVVSPNGAPYPRCAAFDRARAGCDPDEPHRAPRDPASALGDLSERAAPRAAGGRTHGPRR